VLESGEVESISLDHKMRTEIKIGAIKEIIGKRAERAEERGRRKKRVKKINSIKS